MVKQPFKAGDKVYKVAGYQFIGTVRAVFKPWTWKAEWRVVVRLDNTDKGNPMNGDGMLHIFAPSQLAKIQGRKARP